MVTACLSATFPKLFLSPRIPLILHKHSTASGFFSTATPLHTLFFIPSVVTICAPLISFSCFRSVFHRPCDNVTSNHKKWKWTFLHSHSRPPFYRNCHLSCAHKGAGSDCCPSVARAVLARVPRFHFFLLQPSDSYLH